MSGYSVVNVGSPDQWRDFFGGFRPETSRDGRRVVDRELKNEYIGLTVNAFEPGEEAGYWHTHSQVEEVYVFLAGQGQMALDQDIIDVEAGTVVRVGVNVSRTWRAKPDSDGQLQYLCIRAGGSPVPHIPDDAERDTDTPSPWA
jgi:mannose-6-phosphate isomerase-like protein (cupin superfamily)